VAAAARKFAWAAAAAAAAAGQQEAVATPAAAVGAKRHYKRWRPAAEWQLALPTPATAARFGFISEHNPSSPPATWKSATAAAEVAAAAAGTTAATSKWEQLATEQSKCICSTQIRDAVEVS